MSDGSHGSAGSNGVTRAVLRRAAYFDSVSLLQVTAALAGLPGVVDAAAVMATELNRDVLRESGLLVGDAVDGGPNDLVVAVRAADAASAEAALQSAEGQLTRRRTSTQTGGSDGAGQRQAPRSIASAVRRQPGANLAVISVPGQYAAAEARQALARGLHVFLFSDNVSVEDEVALKTEARGKGLLVMGPDCGTALINGIGLGFANVVRRGRIGLVGASGTGLQEVMSLLHQAGEGISHAIGTGGRDLSDPVGAATTRQALELLAQDPTTERIVLISKPPSSRVAEMVLRAAAATRKPIVACLLGAPLEVPAGVQVANDLYQAARLAATAGTWEAMAADDPPRSRRAPGQDQIRGLYCGGTLCEEAELAIGHDQGHVFIDFGDDRYTRGRAHPMIDPSLRNQAILAAGDDPNVAVLLLDVMLGFGSHADPAGATVPAVSAAIAAASRAGRQLAVLAHVVGTDQDPQDLARQEALLRDAGVHVFASNHHAAVAASRLVSGDSA